MWTEVWKGKFMGFLGQEDKSVNSSWEDAQLTMNPLPIQLPWREANNWESNEFWSKFKQICWKNEGSIEAALAENILFKSLLMKFAQQKNSIQESVEIFEHSKSKLLKTTLFENRLTEEFVVLGASNWLPSVAPVFLYYLAHFFPSTNNFGGWWAQ